MTRLIRLRQALPYDKTTVLALFVLALGFAGMAAIAMAEFPRWSDTRFSPLELAIWLTLFASSALAIGQLRECGTSARRFLQVATAAVATVIILRSVDLALDWQGATQWKAFLIANSLVNATLAVILVASLLWLVGSLRGQSWLVAALLGIIGFQIFAVITEFSEAGSMQLRSTEFLELLCIEFYLVGLILAAGRSVSAPALPAPRDAQEFGAFAREAFSRLSLVRDARHPPALIAFVPGLDHLVVFLTAIALIGYAGGPLKRESGISRRVQLRDMLQLWRRHRIDPPSYYALDLYKAANRARAGEYLTRYETKNGLLHVLNFEILRGPPKGELNNKLRFAEICRQAGLACPTTLGVASKGHFRLMDSPAALRRNLFCKPERGFGAIGTFTYTYDAACGLHRSPEGVQLDHDALLQDIARRSTRRDIIVQPWLTNHADIANLANTSLLVFRVITCLDRRGAPVVTLAMLRLLSKLEKEWHHLPDGEYAAPIDLETGKLGLLTGDSPRTASRRYAVHPVGGAAIAGRIVTYWPQVAAFALAVHRAIPYRMVVGWDIALTPEGPVVLEGNTNFDVMFLQRVHDAPIGQTALAPLLRPVIENLYKPEFPPGDDLRPMPHTHGAVARQPMAMSSDPR